MNSTNATTTRSQARNQARTTNGNSKFKLKRRKASAPFDNHIEFAADFVVGALLYSLFGSNRSDAIIQFQAEDEQM